MCPVIQEESEDEAEEEQEATYDYLLPFLPSGAPSGSGALSRDQALEVRERCLKALKDRLIERANIIQVGTHFHWGRTGDVTPVMSQQVKAMCEAVEDNKLTCHHVKCTNRDVVSARLLSNTWGRNM